MNTDAYAAHNVWAVTDAAKAVLKRIDELGDASVAAQLDEMRELLALMTSFRSQGETALFSQSMLDGAANTWNQVVSYLTNYANSPASHHAHLAQAIAYLDPVREAVARFPRPQTSPTFRAGLTNSLKTYQRLIEQSRDALADKLEAEQAAAERREREHAAEVAKLNSQLATMQQELDAMDSRVSKGETRLDSALTGTNDAFNAAQTAREAAFKEWLSVQEDNFNDVAQPFVERAVKVATSAEDMLKEITGLRDSVVTMSNLAAGAILADAYEASAKVDRRAGYIGYVVGAVAGIGSILIVLFAFGGISDALDWQHVSLKAALTAIAGGLAAVAFRFGGQALGRATSYKRQELELRALEPLLHGIDGADEAKVAFISRSFGHSWVAGANTSASTDAAEGLASAEVLKVITTLAERVPKA